MSIMINIIGIHTGHNATAALLQDGVIRCCISEERFNRQKNYTGFPENALQYIFEKYHLSPTDIEEFAMTGTFPSFFLFPSTHDVNKRLGILTRIKKFVAGFEQILPFLDTVNQMYINKIIPRNERRLAEKVDAIIANRLHIDRSRIIRYDHHLCHTATVYYGQCPQDEKILIFSADGGGDMISSTISIAQNGAIKRIAQTSDASSIGGVYSAVTEYLGMKPVEHEYKVMGMAPYAKAKYLDTGYRIFKDIIWLNKRTLTFISKFRTYLTLDHLRKVLQGQRFDAICGAVQKYTEDLLIEWVKTSIKKTGIQKIALTGGVFMNVKANMLIANLPEVKEIFIMPSCGDESIAMGAAFLANQKLSPTCNKKITDLYLGPEFSEEEIEAYFNKNQICQKYNVEKSADIDKEVAKLLSDHKVVARFNGRMEWGARALGNRSILANPSNFDNIRIINEQIKSRDFWMPFAGSILEERAKDYIINPKNISAPYMIVTFPTTEKAQKELRAAMHPYDFTIRPQIVSNEWNPSYHHLISEFEKLTGIGGILNTSFNLHGEPVVCSLADAIHTLEDSGLEYLALGPWLITKKESKQKDPSWTTSS